MIIPEGISVGSSCPREGPVPQTPLLEVGGDLADLPSAAEVRERTGDDRLLTLVAWHVLTHRRTDPIYRGMRTPIPDHAAVGHFERSRWTDEAWEQTDALARTLDAPAVIVRTPRSFRTGTENASRLENFVAHAMRPGLAIAWEWAPTSWPAAKAMSLCERIGSVPVVDPTEHEVPDGELVYLRFRGGASGRRQIREEDLKAAANGVRHRTGWVIFANSTAEQDATRFLEML